MLVSQSHFSYKGTPAPHFSIAMMHSGCSSLPPLDDLLNLSLAVAGGQQHHQQQLQQQLQHNKDNTQAHSSVTASAVAAGGGDDTSSKSSSSSQQLVCYQGVKFALPEEGDVGFCELVPMRLMDLLTNRQEQ